MTGSLPISTTLTALTVVSTTAAYLAYHKHLSISHPVIETSTIPLSLQKSTLYQKVINPASSPAIGSSHSITIPRPCSSHGGQRLSDEEILRRFTLGLWGGWVFTPERNLLQWARPKALMISLPLLRLSKEGHFAGRTGAAAEKATADAVESGCNTEVWSLLDLQKAFQGSATVHESKGVSDAASLKDKIGTTLFGAFRVADAQVKEHNQTTLGDDNTDPVSSSSDSIDFIYGSNTSWIRGVHRFEVYAVPAPTLATTISASSPSTRPAPPTTATAATTPAQRRGDLQNGTGEWVCIRFSSASINPSEAASGTPVGGRFFSGPLTWFHGVYAGMLFRDGLREVLRE